MAQVNGDDCADLVIGAPYAGRGRHRGRRRRVRRLRRRRGGPPSV
ncbi:hypothetical protein [Nonomuraea rubra]